MIKHKKNYDKVIIFIFSLTFVLITAEIVLRWFDLPKLPYSFKNNISYTLPAFDGQPGSFYLKQNSEGFRSRELARRDDAKGCMVYLLGDSHMYGAGVDQKDLVGYSLESHLNHVSQEKKFVVYNLSKQGRSLDAHLNELRQHASLVMPNIVILMVYSGNDLIELWESNVNACGTKTKSITKPTQNILADFLARVKPVLRTIRIYHLIVQSKNRLLGYPLLKCSSYTQSFCQASYFISHPDTLAEGLRLFEKHLLLMKSFLPKECRFIVCVLPPKTLVDTEKFDNEARRILNGLKLDEYLIKKVDNRLYHLLIERAHANGFETIDLEKVLKNSGISKNKYWLSDWHLNTVGHRIVASFLVSYLLNQSKTAELA